MFCDVCDRHSLRKDALIRLRQTCGNLKGTNLVLSESGESVIKFRNYRKMLTFPDVIDLHTGSIFDIVTVVRIAFAMSHHGFTVAVIAQIFWLHYAISVMQVDQAMERSLC